MALSFLAPMVVLLLKLEAAVFLALRLVYLPLLVDQAPGQAPTVGFLFPMLMVVLLLRLEAVLVPTLELAAPHLQAGQALEPVLLLVITASLEHYQGPELEVRPQLAALEAALAPVALALDLV